MTSRMESAAGEQHNAPVDADAQAARGGQTVLQGGEEVLVHHAGLVAPCPAAPPASGSAGAGRWGR